MLALYRYDTCWIKDDKIYKGRFEVCDNKNKNKKIYCNANGLIIVDKNEIFYGGCKNNLPEGENVINVICNQMSIFIFTENNRLFCFGQNTNNELGFKSTKNILFLREIEYDFGDKIKKIDTCIASSFIVTYGGKLFVTGTNSDYHINFISHNKQKKNLFKEKSEYSFVDYTKEYKTFESEFVIDVNCGAEFCLVTTQKKISYFGNEIYIKKIKCENFLYANFHKIKKIICSRQTAFFLLNDDSLFGIGCNTYGQMAQGDFIDRDYVVQIFFNYGKIFDIYCHKFGDTLIVENTQGEFYGCGENIGKSLCVDEECDIKVKYNTFQKLLYYNNVKKINENIESYDINLETNDFLFI
jgi:alpha-tubulin suppressor-like RCC1 family protein